MKISAKTKINDLLDHYPFLMEYFLTKSPKFENLKRPIMRKTVGKFATLQHVASVGDLQLSDFLEEIANEIATHTGEAVPTETAATDDTSRAEDSEAKKEVLKGIIRDLHNGEDVQVLKERFRELIQDVSPTEIAGMEQELISEGLPESEVKRLCDVHVAVFEESLNGQERPSVPAGHPVNTFMEENRAAESIIEQTNVLLDALGDPVDVATYRENKEQIADLLHQLAMIDTHYTRKENQLFPLLESHGVTGPPQVMWAVHDDIRSKIKQTIASLEQEDYNTVLEHARDAMGSVGDMIYKEERILFPMALEILTDSDWAKVAHGEEEIGYAWIEPPVKWMAETLAEPTEAQAENAGFEAAELVLDTGLLSLEQVNLMLNHLPVDITFVNESDRVAYFSQGKERIFPRSPAVIGREVQKCHPPKSLHMVERIINEFKAGTKDSAEFWIQMGEKFIHIRYFAVRTERGEYKGTLEVSQDVAEIRNLEGEQRLLDWQ